MNKIKKGDEVVVISGRDKGKRGAVLRLIGGGRVLVEGVNRVKKHQKPNPNKGITGGIVDIEMSMHISNVAIFNPVTKVGDRVSVKQLDDGRRVRVFRSNGEMVDIK